MVEINNRTPQRGDIIQLNLDPRTGSEQSGYRPAIVISPNVYNQKSRIIVACPITSQQKGWPFEVKLPNVLQTYGVVLVDHIKSIDPTARQARFIEESTPALMDEILRKLKMLTT